jgi:oligogalacturonide transporter
MLPEVTDYDEAMSGGRNEGVYSGIMTFIRKLSSSAAILGIGAMLEWSGYASGAAVQPASAIRAIRMATIVIPLALSLLAAFFASRFRIGPGNLGRIRALVDLRRSGDFDKLPVEEQRKRVEEVRL